MKFCPLPSTPTVCFPARVAWSRVLTGAHTHASGEHPAPSQDLVGVFQILRMSLSRSLRFVVVVVFVFFVAVGYRLPNSSGFPFVHFDLEKVSPPWLNF